MDAVEYLKEKNRICRKYGEFPGDCFECPIGNDSGGCQAGVFENQKVTEEILVQIVERWAAEHPKKTRQSEFLKMFPRVRTDDDGVIYMDPCDVDTSYENENRCDNIPCRDCKKEYWLAEVDND